MIETYSGPPGKSSAIFGNFRERSFGLRKNFGKSSERSRKSSENRRKHRHQYIYIIKRTLHVSSKIGMLCSRGKNNISLVCHSNIKFISSRHRLNTSAFTGYRQISSIYFVVDGNKGYSKKKYLISRKSRAFLEQCHI